VFYFLILAERKRDSNWERGRGNGSFPAGVTATRGSARGRKPYGAQPLGEQ
jgi:hypothetical protein